MGKVGDVLFGSPSKQKSESESHSQSGNYAWPAVSSAMTPVLGNTAKGSNAIGALLGLPGYGDQTGALDNWANAGGMQWQMDQGNRMINSNQAAKGLLNSGSTLTGIQKYGQGLGSTYLNQYMGHLNEFSRLGLGAAGAMTGAGGWTKSDSKSKGTGTGAKEGIAGDLLAAAAVACDPRLKTDIVAVTTQDGLVIYDFTYRQDAELKLPEGRFRGVMADEVARVRPEALGPTRKGYLTISDPNLFPKKIG